MSIQHPFTVYWASVCQRFTNRSTHRLLISLLSVLALLFSDLTLAADNNKKEPYGVILILGDSISAGYGLRQGEGWVSLLEKRLQTQNYSYRVINASISGETTQGGLARLPELLRQHQPDLVLLELGGNDGLRGLPLHLMQNNLSRMIDISRQASAQPLLLGIQLPPNYGRRYTTAFAATYPQLAEQKKIPVVPFILEKIAIYPDLMQSDGVHPKAEAQRQLLDNIWPALEALLKQPS
ncbi:arylesterase [Oceanospirillum sp.]|uniref:arylesterase n=1 Tax=Oceanospirillum sp. TaxID=2021254 RepID=UPI003A94BA2A